MAAKTTRRSQSVVPFGVGSIVEFENEALMPAGLDVWPVSEAESIYDDRLAERLRVTHFLVPPPRPEIGGPAGVMAPLPYVRFPRWHFCPRCRALKRADLYARNRPRCDNSHESQRLRGRPPCSKLSPRQRLVMYPLRFVAVCPQGHIEDFPWSAWAHTAHGQALRADDGCLPETLYFYATRLGGLGGLLVQCGTCGKKRSLMGSTAKGGLKGWTCNGNRPWLGDDARETCNVPAGPGGLPVMLALQRGASNLYFPQVASSILIPPHSTQIYQVLSDPRIRDALDSAVENGRVPDASFKTIAKVYKIDTEQLKDAYYTMSSPIAGEVDSDESAYRYAEFRALCQERREPGDMLICRPQDRSSYSSLVKEYFENITLVERLSETRALTSFTRIGTDLNAVAQLSRGRVGWLPAFRVHGEGIFLSLDFERIKKFDRQPDLRLEPLLERIRNVGRATLPVSRGFILLHSLAHLLIKRLSFEAGYGASSIRERIYSAPAGSDREMAGILLYTAAGDSDGTLGGLVNLGRAGNLERIIAGVLEEARWCGSDPICMESGGQGPESLNMAACHACTLVAETSCEFQNRMLDRMTVTEFFD